MRGKRIVSLMLIGLMIIGGINVTNAQGLIGGIQNPLRDLIDNEGIMLLSSGGGTKTVTVNIGEGSVDKSELSKVVTIPNLKSAKVISVSSGGSATLSVSGNNVTVNAKGGTPSRTEDNAKKWGKEVSVDVTQKNDNKFSTSHFYYPSSDDREEGYKSEFIRKTGDIKKVRLNEKTWVVDYATRMGGTLTISTIYPSELDHFLYNPSTIKAEDRTGVMRTFEGGKCIGGVLMDGEDSRYRCESIEYFYGQDIYSYNYTQKYAGTIYKAGVDNYYSYKVVIEYEQNETKPPHLQAFEDGNSSPQRSHSTTLISTDESGIRDIKYQWSQSLTPNESNWVENDVGVNKTNENVTKFVRGSEAYSRGANKVGIGEPVYELGRFGKGISIEPRVVNVFSNPIFNTPANDGGWSHWNSAGASGSYGQNTLKKYIHGDQEYSHWVDNPASATGYNLLYQNPSLGGKPGVSSVIVIAKKDDETPITHADITPGWNGRSGGAEQNKWTSIKRIGSTGFYELRVDGISQDGSNDLVGVRVLPGKKIYFSKMHIERRPYSTSFTEGIKAAEKYTIDTKGILDHNEGTVEGYWVPRQPLDTLTDQQHSPPIVQIGNYHTPSSMTLWVINKQIRLWVRGSVDSAPGPTQWSSSIIIKDEKDTADIYEVGKPIHYAVKWKNADTFWVTINGETSGPYKINDPLTKINGDYVGLGNVNVSGGENNFIMDNMRISNIARTNEELKESYESNRPVGWDENTVYLMDFEDNLLQSSGGVVNISGDDGVYYLHARAEDKSGNKTDLSTKGFLLDNTVPTVGISPMGNSTPSKTAKTIVTVRDENMVGDSGYAWTKSKEFPRDGWDGWNESKWNRLKSPDEKNMLLWVDTTEGSNEAKTKVLKDKSGNGNDVELIGFNFDGNLNSGWYGGELRLDGLTNLIKTPELSNVKAIEMTIKIDEMQAEDYWNYIIDARSEERKTTRYVANRGTGTDWGDMYVNGVKVDTNFNNIPRDRWVTVYIESKVNFDNTINFFSRYTDDESLKGSLREIKIYNEAIDVTGAYKEANVEVEFKRGEDYAGDGNYYLHVLGKDSAGNETRMSSNAFLIDNTRPIKPMLKSDNTEYTNKSVGVEIEYSEKDSKKEYKIGEGPWVDARGKNYAYEENNIIVDMHENGKVYARETDVAGNVSYIGELTVGNIDKEAPEVKIVENGNTDPRKVHGTVVNVTDKFPGVASLKYMWSHNKNLEDTEMFWDVFRSGDRIENSVDDGEIYLHIRATDRAGNETNITSNMFMMKQNNSPEIKVDSKDKDYKINKNGEIVITGTVSDLDKQKLKVSAIIGGVEKTVSLTSPAAGRKWSLKWLGSELSEGVYTDILFEVDDGIEKAQDMYVGEIIVDKTKPSVSYHMNGSESPKKGHTSKVTVNDKHGIKNIKYMWSDRASFPSTTIGWTNVNVEGSNKDFEVKRDVGDGYYYVHVISEDIAGNIIKSTSNRFNFDNTPPVDPVITLDNSNWTNKNKFATIEYSDDSVNKQYKIGDTGDWTRYDDKVTIYSNTTIYARAYDEAGNVNENVSKEIKKIDRTKPKLTVTGNPNNWVDDQAVKLVVRATDEASGVKRVQLPNGIWKNITGEEILEYEVLYEVEDNGKYKFIVEDVAGNIGELIVEVNKINKIAKVKDMKIDNVNDFAGYKIIPRGDFYVYVESEVEEKDKEDIIKYVLSIKNTDKTEIYRSSEKDVSINNTKGNTKDMVWIVNNRDKVDWPDGIYTATIELREHKPGRSEILTSQTGELKFIILKDTPPVPIISYDNSEISVEYPDHKVLNGILGGALKKEYSIDDSKFVDYTGLIGVNRGNKTITARYTDINGNSSFGVRSIVQLIPERVEDIISTDIGINVEESVIGKNIFFNIRKRNSEVFDRSYFKIFNR